jgi:hypothetical protein
MAGAVVWAVNSGIDLAAVGAGVTSVTCADTVKAGSVALAVVGAIVGETRAVVSTVVGVADAGA